VQGHRGEAHLEGLWPIQRKSCFFAPKGYGGREKSIAISAACEENSLLSGSMEDQLNFFADQRILRALTIE
jgi:hypothetical protein